MDNEVVAVRALGVAARVLPVTVRDRKIGPRVGQSQRRDRCAIVHGYEEGNEACDLLRYSLSAGVRAQQVSPNGEML